MSLNTDTQLALINTQANSGVIQLPNTLTKPGRVITFKDSVGQFQLSSLRLLTRVGDTIDNQQGILQRNHFGWTTLASGATTTWYTIGGTQINTLITSTVNAGFVSSGTLAIPNVSSISTLFLPDKILNTSNNLSVFSTILFYSTGTTSTIVAGGARQSFGGLFLRVRA
jgi:hypothetical protein